MAEAERRKEAQKKAMMSMGESMNKNILSNENEILYDSEYGSDIGSPTDDDETEIEKNNENMINQSHLQNQSQIKSEMSEEYIEEPGLNMAENMKNKNKNKSEMKDWKQRQNKKQIKNKSSSIHREIESDMYECKKKEKENKEWSMYEFKWENREWIIGILKIDSVLINHCKRYFNQKMCVSCDWYLKFNKQPIDITNIKNNNIFPKLMPSHVILQMYNIPFTFNRLICVQKYHSFFFNDITTHNTFIIDNNKQCTKIYTDENEDEEEGHEDQIEDRENCFQNENNTKGIKKNSNVVNFAFFLSVFFF